MEQPTADALRALIERGRAAEAVALADASLAGLDGAARAEMLRVLAAAHTARGDFQPALRAGVESCALFEAAADHRGLCDALVQTATTLRIAGDYATAMTTLEQAEALARSSQDALRTARVQRSIGIVSSLLGRHQHALSCLGDAVQALAVLAAGDEVRNAQLSMMNAASRRLESLPSDASTQAAIEATLPAWQALAAEAEAAGQARLALMARGNHAIELRRSGHGAEAMLALQALVPQYRLHDMRPNEALAHAEIGLCCEARGDAAAALDHYRAAITLQHDADATDDLLSATEGLARCHEQLADPAAALAALKQVRQIEKRRSDALARQALLQRELRIELAQLTNQWSRQALLDPLTGLANRRALERWLNERWPRVERGQTLAILLLDLDHFKQVNDGHGHAVGDAVLQGVGRLLQAHGRAADLAVRYGGEEFLLALDDTDGAGAAAFALRLRQSVADHPWAAVAPALAVTTSIGVAAAGEAQDINALLALADQRLYAAKLAGRNRVVAHCQAA